MARTTMPGRIVLRNTTNTPWRQLWTRQLSTKGRAGGTTPWHHRIGYSTPSQMLLRQNQSKVVGRESFKSGSPLRWRKSCRTSKRSFHTSETRKSQSSSTDAKSPPAESLSLSQRLKKLSREYGWAAVGVYLSLSILDFPFCFLLVRVVGTDRIGQEKNKKTIHSLLKSSLLTLETFLHINSRCRRSRGLKSPEDHSGAREDILA